MEVLRKRSPLTLIVLKENRVVENRQEIHGYTKSCFHPVLADFDLFCLAEAEISLIRLLKTVGGGK